MVGGGLMQLVAYGAQDIYIQSQLDTCILNSYYTCIKERKYDNFELNTIYWCNKTNIRFTEKKYDELLDKYINMDYLIINPDLDLKKINIEVVKGNTEISHELTRQITSTKALIKKERKKRRALKNNKHVNKHK